VFTIGSARWLLRGLGQEWCFRLLEAIDTQHHR
jgi:hypothetical protein